MLITLADYWMGRDEKYAHDLTVVIKDNAEELVQRVNLVLTAYSHSGLPLHRHPVTGSYVSSGWRPPSVNAGVPNAAPRSKHMTGQACDIYDPEGELDDWCWDHQQTLIESALWLEHPAATKGWTHFQSVPPRSLKRFFYP